MADNRLSIGDAVYINVYIGKPTNSSLTVCCKAHVCRLPSRKKPYYGLIISSVHLSEKDKLRYYQSLLGKKVNRNNTQISNKIPMWIKPDARWIEINPQELIHSLNRSKNSYQWK